MSSSDLERSTRAVTRRRFLRTCALASGGLALVVACGQQPPAPSGKTEAPAATAAPQQAPAQKAAPTAAPTLAPAKPAPAAPTEAPKPAASGDAPKKTSSVNPLSPVG